MQPDLFTTGSFDPALKVFRSILDKDDNGLWSNLQFKHFDVLVGALCVGSAVMFWSLHRVVDCHGVAAPQLVAFI